MREAGEKRKEKYFNMDGERQNQNYLKEHNLTMATLAITKLRMARQDVANILNGKLKSTKQISSLLRVVEDFKIGNAKAPNKVRRISK